MSLILLVSVRLFWFFNIRSSFRCSCGQPEGWTEGDAKPEMTVVSGWIKLQTQRMTTCRWGRSFGCLKLTFAGFPHSLFCASFLLPMRLLLLLCYYVFYVFESTQIGDEEMIREIHECGCWGRHEPRMLLVTLLLSTWLQTPMEKKAGMVDKQWKRGLRSGEKTSHHIRFTGDGIWIGSRPGWLNRRLALFRLLRFF